MLGFRNDSAEIVGAFDVYLSSALYEGLPYSMIEAMRAGVPIIATDCIGNNELVFEGDNGWMYPVKNVAKGAELVVKQIDNEIIQSDKVIATFNLKFSLTRMLENVEREYQL